MKFGYKHYNNKAKEAFAESLILLGNEIYKKILLFFIGLVLMSSVNLEAKIEFMQIDLNVIIFISIFFIILAESLKVKGLNMLNEL